MKTADSFANAVIKDKLLQKKKKEKKIRKSVMLDVPYIPEILMVKC